MANSDYERRAAHDYIDQYSDHYDANSWGMIFGIVAVVGIIAMLFIGFSAGPDRPATEPTAIERTAPTPTPTAPTAPTAPPATTPN